MITETAEKKKQTRSLMAFLKDIITELPAMFPLVALAHVLWLIFTIWSDRYEPFGTIAWLQVLWMIGYTVCWIAASDKRKWGAIGYMLLTLTNIIIFLTARTITARELYMSNLFLIDGVFSFFLLFYYKKLRK
jgi:hypothetical protein